MNGWVPFSRYKMYGWLAQGCTEVEHTRTSYLGRSERFEFGFLYKFLEILKLLRIFLVPKGQDKVT